VTGLVAGGNKTVEVISNHVLLAKSERALNKYLTEYDGDEEQLNRERLELLQEANDTKWSSDGVVNGDDTFTHKTVRRSPALGNSTTTLFLGISGDKISSTRFMPTKKLPTHLRFASTKGRTATC